MEQIKFDFMVSVSYNNGIPLTKEFMISNYEADEKETGYKKLQKDVLNFCNKNNIFWVEIAIIAKSPSMPTYKNVKNYQIIMAMKGDIEWFKHIEYFTKYIGSMGGDIGLEASAIGFIDTSHKIRVEFENGMILLSHLKQ